jgi:hypothetical protein
MAVNRLRAGEWQKSPGNVERLPGMAVGNSRIGGDSGSPRGFQAISPLQKLKHIVRRCARGKETRVPPPLPRGETWTH